MSAWRKRLQSDEYSAWAGGLHLIVLTPPSEEAKEAAKQAAIKKFKSAIAEVENL